MLPGRLAPITPGVLTAWHAAKAVEAVLTDRESSRFARRNDGMDFETYKQVVGYDEWQGIEDRFA
jgi:hypothetical protein